MIRYIKSFLQKQLGYGEEQLVPLSYIFKYFWKINWLKTWFFNFKALPLKQATHIPFIVGYKCRIRHIGKITLNGRVSPGMISVGVLRLLTDTNAECLVWTNGGGRSFSMDVQNFIQEQKSV